MAAKLRIIKRDNLLDGIFACSLAVILVIIVLGDQLPISAFGADNSKSNLVPYFVTWHVTGRGYYQDSSANKSGVHVWTERDIWDVAGSAITRFQNYSGLTPLDTHYLTVTARRDHDIWQEYSWYSSPPSDCFGHDSFTIADTGSYSGFTTSINGDEHRLFMGTSEQRNGATISFHHPFITLMSMKFISHIVHESSCGSSTPPSDMNQNPLAEITPDSPDLFADRDDASSFSVDTRYTPSGPPGKMEVHWTAHAYLMGKCAERDGPIQEDDPIVTHEQVDLDAEDPVVTPDGDGKTNVKIRVTCDRVPIQNAEVEVKLEVENTSGYHDHEDDNRPLGQLDGKELNKDSRITLKTDDNGYAYAPSSKTKRVKFEPPPFKKATDHARYGDYLIGIAGTYKVTAKTTSKRIPESSGTVAIKARVDGLVSMDSPPTASYVLDRGGTSAHQQGSWGTPGTLQAFKNLANDLQKYQELHNVALESCGKTRWDVQKLSINDIALPDGGLFDANSTWSPPKHQTHNRGEGGDFNRFGAGASTGVNTLGTGTECDGSTVKITGWLIHVLLDLGSSYGHWDCSDLGINNCTHAELPTMPWIAKNLHLHVED